MHRLPFAAGSNGGPNPVERHGVIRIQSSAMVLNLHRPRTAAALIRAVVELGWSAETPMTIEDGISFVAALPEAVQADIAESGAAAVHSSSPEGASA